MSNLLEYHNKIFDESRALHAAWVTTKEVWNDLAREDFEHKHWATFEMTTTRVSGTLETLMELVRQAENDIM